MTNINEARHGPYLSGYMLAQCAVPSINMAVAESLEQETTNKDGDNDPGASDPILYLRSLVMPSACQGSMVP